MPVLAANYLWEFGDGEISTDQNPEHIYSMPGTYDVTLTVTDVDGGLHTVEYIIYAYDMDYTGSGETPSQYDIDHSYRLQQGLTYARVVTHSDKCYRYAIPQEQSQGAGWAEYNGDNWPMAVGITGCSTILDRNDEKVSLVLDSYSFKEYQLGKDDWWVDGGNDVYAGSEIESEILLRENVNPTGATSRLKHSQSRADFKPWWKDRRSTGSYNSLGFTDNFSANLFVRKDSTPYDAAITKQVPRKGQIVFDRNIESEFLQMGLIVRGAPWRMTYAEQQYISRDTGANPDLKKMSELGWSLEASEPMVWIGRDSSIQDTGNLPLNAATGVQVTGSYSVMTTGPDGYAKSAFVFGAADSFVCADIAEQNENFSLIMWLRNPATGTVLWESSDGGLRVVYVLNPDGTRKVEYYDDNNHFNIPLSVSTADWFMLTIVRRDDDFIVYVNADLVNTYGLIDSGAVYGDIEVCQGSCAAWGIRMIPRALTADAVTYHYNDVIENKANATENIF